MNVDLDTCIREVECPRCGATGGDHCTIYGEASTRFHAARYDRGWRTRRVRQRDLQGLI